MDNCKTVGQVSRKEVFSIPVSKITHLLYCSRKFYMDLHFPAVKKKRNNQKTTTKKVRTVSYAQPKTRAIDLQMKTVKINGRVRVLSNTEDEVIPVLVQVKRDAQALREADVKVAAYCLMLREAGYKCNEYIISSKGNNIKHEIDENSLNQTINLIKEGEKLLDQSFEPEGTPGVHCRFCRFKSSCRSKIKLVNTKENIQLDEVNQSRSIVVPEAIAIYSAVELLEAPPVIRDAFPLYVRSQGSQVGVDSGSFIVSKNHKEIARALITDISQISLFGNIQITNQCLRKAIREEIPVAFFSSKGSYYGMAGGFSYNNAHYKKAQYLSLTGTKPLEICRVLVATKLLSQRIILKKRTSSATERKLFKLSEKAVQSKSVDELRGFEGAGAAMYFSEFPNLLAGKRNEDKLTFSTRNRRPPKDPVNAMLSFGYSLLSKEFVVAIELAGLDPMQGFYHTDRNRRPALALDLMEPFRASFVDSVVLGMIKRGQVTEKDFMQEENAVIMKSDFRRKFIASWEKRLQRPWTTDTGLKTDCRGMIQLLVRDLVSFLLNRKEKFNVPLFR